AHHPRRSAKCPGGKDDARGGTMRDLDALCLPEKVGNVLADDIATAQGRDADLAARPSADLAVSSVALDLVVIGAVTRCDRARDRERGARRRVALGAMVGLDDLGIPFRAERARSLAHETEHEVDAE